MHRTHALTSSLIALACFGCAGKPESLAPTAPSAFEREVSLPESAPALTSPAAVSDDADETIGPIPADGESIFDVPVELDATPDAEVELDADVQAQLGAPDAEGAFAVPGKPINVQVNSNGLDITMTWGPAPPGTAGGPNRYLVYCNCTGRIETVGPLVFRKVWRATKPGKYTFFVAGANSKGAGPTVNLTRAVGYEGTYTNRTPATQTASFTRRFSTFTCTWRITIRVTSTVTLKSATAGTNRIAGSWSTPKPSAKCNAGASAFSNTANLAFNATGFSSNHTIDLVTGRFEGSFVGAAIKGFLRMTYRWGTGRWDIPLTLNSI